MFDQYLILSNACNATKLLHCRRVLMKVFGDVLHDVIHLYAIEQGTHRLQVWILLPAAHGLPHFLQAPFALEEVW